ncbi:cation:proton antiporter domain-containing protein [Prosthecodimorpha staleyi]|uniref:Cation:proton antiporter n=1 Tax=Prosthecodimorpha staleyi TaxID=2840188 RepID=A0A947DA72_9HYPH|nr:cation:proton antiporter [Prosthecodimorpha staleyi]MBT9291372.1 cation:proton antiporter [Prosthecodimorpha staleyi]
MAGQVDLTHFKDALLVLGTAGVVVPIVHRLKVSPILGYLAAGAVLGPNGLGQFHARVPYLEWVTIQKTDEIAGIAELGIVFLLFFIGLELSFGRLATMRRYVFGLGLLQVLISGAVLAGLAGLFGLKPDAAILIGASLALSSTAIVVELLATRKRLTSTTGRVTFAILLLQDLAVVPILFLVETLGAGQDGSLVAGLGWALLQAAVAIALIVGLGKLVLSPLFRFVAETRDNELFIATTLLVVVGTGVASAAAGLSMALGAFVAGLLIAETEYRRAVEHTIEPFKGLLLGVFFFSVGMSIDFGRLIADPILIVGLAVALVAAKMLICTLLARGFGVAWPAAIETGALIGAGGEFAFIVIGLAVTTGIVDRVAGSIAPTVVAITMAALPAMASLGRRLGRRLEQALPADPETLVAPPEEAGGRTIVVGHGRVGALVGTMLERHRQPYIAIDRDPTTVTLARRKGKPVYFGDITKPDFLRACGLDSARAVVVTVNSPTLVDDIVTVIRTLRPDAVIVARARDATHATKLYAMGVTNAVPETIEASLQLSEAALVGLGVPMGPVIASIHDKRDEYRQMLKQSRTTAPQP